MSDDLSITTVDAASKGQAAVRGRAEGNWLSRIPDSLKIRAGIGLIALGAVAASALMWSRQPDWRVLFSGLADKDGGAVIASLTQMNVPYRYTEGGGAIQVPAERLHDARLKLASQGLPKGSTSGYELLENQKFGTTQFQERINFQRGLEGELARSIQSLDAVDSARVHLALPNQAGFLRDSQKPSASVVLSLRGGRTLDRQQVAGIVHMVASSVPQLETRQVSIVDQNGSLLSNLESTQGLDATQLSYLRNVESQLSARIVDLITPIVGSGNVRAQVSADLDFTQQESTAEQYRPNQTAEQAAIRSQQSLESSDRSGAGGAAQGIPGALSNQPPQTGQAPVNGVAQATRAAGPAGGAGAGGAGAAGAGGADTSQRRETTTNYEVDKTIRVTRQPVGAMRRLSVAILLNQRQSTGADGKTVSVPISAQELESINALARDAIGFSQQRGDSINVVNVAFNRDDNATPAETALPWWKDPAHLGLAREALKQLGLIVVALLIFRNLIRPAIRSAQQQGTPRLRASVDDALQLPDGSVFQAGNKAGASGSLPAPEGSPKLASVGPSNQALLELARSNPTAVANVVRHWINDGEAEAA